MITMRDRDLDLADPAELSGLNIGCPCLMMGQQRILLGNLHQRSICSTGAEQLVFLQRRAGWRLGQHRDTQSRKLQQQGGGSAFGYSQNYKVAVRGKTFDRAIHRKLPLVAHLLVLVPASDQQAADLEMLRKQPGDPEIILRAPAAADNAKANRSVHR
ncbi:hypothetical protein D3C73_1070170 [compost metagenome]